MRSAGISSRTKTTIRKKLLFPYVLLNDKNDKGILMKIVRLNIAKSIGKSKLLENYFVEIEELYLKSSNQRKKKNFWKERVIA